MTLSGRFLEASRPRLGPSSTSTPPPGSAPPPTPPSTGPLTRPLASRRVYEHLKLHGIESSARSRSSPRLDGPPTAPRCCWSTGTCSTSYRGWRSLQGAGLRRRHCAHARQQPGLFRGGVRDAKKGGRDHFQGCQVGRFDGIESDGAVKGCPSLQTSHYVGGYVDTHSGHSGTPPWSGLRATGRRTTCGAFVGAANLPKCVAAVAPLRGHASWPTWQQPLLPLPRANAGSPRIARAARSAGARPRPAPDQRPLRDRRRATRSERSRARATGATSQDLDGLSSSARRWIAAGAGRGCVECELAARSPADHLAEWFGASPCIPPYRR